MCLAWLNRALQYAVEHRLQISWRATDNLEHLGSGGFASMRLG